MRTDEEAMIFADRLDAARRLATALDACRGRNPLILAIPRGAVPMGAALATELGGDLDVVLVQKLGAPRNPEYAVGAIDESGWSFVSDAMAADEAWLRRERACRFDQLRRRHADEVVCLHAPRNFNAVGQFYARFDQVEDDEVIACLRRFRPAAPARR
jgi:predicted phosphoribosyltransferase